MEKDQSFTKENKTKRSEGPPLPSSIPPTPLQSSKRDLEVQKITKLLSPIDNNEEKMNRRAVAARTDELFEYDAEVEGVEVRRLRDMYEVELNSSNEADLSRSDYDEMVSKGLALDGEDYTAHLYSDEESSSSYDKYDEAEYFTDFDPQTVDPILLRELKAAQRRNNSEDFDDLTTSQGSDTAPSISAISTVQRPIYNTKEAIDRARQSADLQQFYDALANRDRNKPIPIDLSLFYNKLAERDWNKEFQTILRLPNSATKFTHLSRLAKDFLYRFLMDEKSLFLTIVPSRHASKLYAKIIVSELYLPDAKKTPVDLGGVAGGSKYICQGILFKVALDVRGIYGGDHNAMKAAGHELKGLMAFYNCQIEGINVPLMAIIYYKGFAVTAMSLLPIERNTIIYGSNDSGNTVKNEDKAFAGLMTKAAATLNLKEHVAGENQQRIIGPADIEGHLSKSDGRFYLVDFARTMPPQVKLRPKMKQHMFELLRPELVKSNPIALSSDALTRMGRFDPQQKEHNQDVAECCDRLFLEVIPELAQYLEKELRPGKIEQAAFLPIPPNNNSSNLQRFDDLISKLHRFGVNIRHLGFLLKLVKSPPLQKTILIEMISRILKDGIRSRLRTTTQKLKVPASEPYRQVVINFLNDIFVKSRQEFWKKTIKTLLKEKYFVPLDLLKMNENYDLLSDISIPELLSYTLNTHKDLSGVKLRENSISLLAFGAAFIVDSDLIKISTRVRSMNIIPEAEAMVLSLECTKRVGTERNRLFQLSVERFHEAITISPNSRFAYYECGKMLHFMAKTVTSPSAQVHLLASAIQKLSQAVTIDANYLEAHLALGNATLDFVINEHRMKVIAQSKNPGLIYQMGDMIKDAAKHFKAALTGNGNDLNTFSSQLAHLPPIPLTASLQALSPSGSKVKSDTEGETIDLHSSSDSMGVKSPPPSLIVQLRSENLANKAKDIKLFALLETSIIVPVLQPSLLERCRKLNNIFVRNCIFVSWKTLELFSTASNSLNHIGLHYAILNDTIVNTLAKSLPNLHSLDLTGCKGITSWSTAFAKSLTRVTLDYCLWPQTLMEQIFKLHSNLEVLSLNGSNITDETLNPAIVKLTNLKVLSLAAFRDQANESHMCLNVKKISLDKEIILEKLDLSGCSNLLSSSVVSISKYSPKLKRLVLDDCKDLNDATIVSLSKNCACIRSLSLANTNIGDEGVKAIGRNLQELVYLNLENCDRMSGQVVRQISGASNLEILNLSGAVRGEFDAWLGLLKHSQSTDFGDIIRLGNSFERFGNFASLKTLELKRWAQLTDVSVQALLKYSPNLISLDLSDCPQITDKSLLLISEKLCDSLQLIALNNCNQITDIGMERGLSRCRQLLTVSLNGCTRLTEASFASLSHGCKRIQILECSNVDGVTNESIQMLLHRLNDIEVLDIRNCKLVTAEFIAKQLRHQNSRVRLVLEPEKEAHIYAINS